VSCPGQLAAVIRFYRGLLLESLVLDEQGMSSSNFREED